MQRFLFSALMMMMATPAFAKTIEVEVSDEITYESVRAYSDGVLIIENPMAYGFPVSGSTNDLNNNGRAICAKLGVTYSEAKDTTVPTPIDIMTYVWLNSNQPQPKFDTGRIVIRRLICRRS